MDLSHEHMRRPAAPRLRSGSPGVPTSHMPTPGVQAPPPQVSDPVPEAISAPSVLSAPSAHSAPSALSAPPASPSSPAAARPARRGLLVDAGATALLAPAVWGLSRVLGAPSNPSAPPTAAPSTAPGPFLDVPGDMEGAAAMAWAHEHHVLEATDGRFHPETVMTHGDLARALHAFAGSPTVPLRAVPRLLEDLPEDPATAQAMLWLHGHGALWGDASLRLDPGTAVARDDAARVLTALVRPSLVAFDASIDALDAADSPFEDLSDEDLALSDVLWLAAAKILPGAPRGRWRGAESLTRADLAIALHSTQTLIDRVLP